MVKRFTIAISRDVAHLPMVKRFIVGAPAGGIQKSEKSAKRKGGDHCFSSTA